MSEAVAIAGFLVCAGAIGWLAKLIVDHLRECRKIQADAATTHAMLIATLERIEREIGDHETGLRGRLHDQQNALLKLEGRVSRIDRWGNER